jgi:hypothetical protein
MLELADIFRAAGPAYEQAHAGRLLPSHRRAMDDIVRCRTPALGGSLYACDDCGALDYAYHSCRNRHCPKCQEDRAHHWLTRLRARLLPCDHYLLTFTLPSQLRAVARSHHKLVYTALLREAAAAVQMLADDRTWVGGTLGILAVLHTWSRTLEYHPHAHLLYHVALTNHRLERFEPGRVTFRYTHARTHERRRMTLPVDAFIARFLQHVLPRGFTKIRYYGLLSPTGRAALERARHLLSRHATTAETTTPRPGAALHDTDARALASSAGAGDNATATGALPAARCCPVCRRGLLRLVERYRRSRAPPS